MTKTWIKAAGIRAIKTFAQAAVAAIGASVVLNEVDWLVVASTAGLAAVLSILTSIGGLPEVKEKKQWITSRKAIHTMRQKRANLKNTPNSGKRLKN